MTRWAPIALISALLSLGPTARAAEADKEPFAELEIGGMGERSLQDAGSGFGPSVAVEITPIEQWLEIEVGTAALFRNGGTEWDTDLVFKKPYTLSNTVEFMLGGGPEWIHRTSGAQLANSIGAEAVLEFMIWPWPERKFGWFVEPSYGYDFGKGHEQSLGVNVGVIIKLQ